MQLVKTESIEQAMFRKEIFHMVAIKSEFEEFYVTKETSIALVWEIERATFEHAEIVYQAVIDRTKLAAGL